MNYLSEILGFYVVVQGSELTSTQIVLWHALMYMDNKQGWKEWFIAPGVDLKALTGIKSSTTITDNLKVLKKLGLIDYKTMNGGRALFKMKSISKSGMVAGMVGGMVSGMVGGMDTGMVGVNPLEELNINTNNSPPGDAPGAQGGKKRNGRPLYPHDSPYYRFALSFAKKVQENCTVKVKSPTEANLQRWADEIRLLVEYDKVPYEEAVAAAVFVTTNRWWRQGRCTSCVGFREKYTNIVTSERFAVFKEENSNGGTRWKTLT